MEEWWKADASSVAIEAKTRIMGTISLIGELYKQKALGKSVMRIVLQKSLAKAQESADDQQIVQLIEEMNTALF